MLRATASSTLFVLALSLSAAGCGDDATTPTPSGPDPVTITESFQDTLNPNGGRTHAFVVDRAGSVTVKFTSLAPDAAAVLGLSLGTFNPATNVCQVLLANDAATLNTTVSGTASVAGIFCARVYDVGRITGPVTYTVEVTHF